MKRGIIVGSWFFENKDSKHLRTRGKKKFLPQKDLKFNHFGKEVSPQRLSQLRFSLFKPLHIEITHQKKMQFSWYFWSIVFFLDNFHEENKKSKFSTDFSNKRAQLSLIWSDLHKIYCYKKFMTNLLFSWLKITSYMFLLILEYVWQHHIFFYFASSIFFFFTLPMLWLN